MITGSHHRQIGSKEFDCASKGKITNCIPLFGALNEQTVWHWFEVLLF